MRKRQTLFIINLPKGLVLTRHQVGTAALGLIALAGPIVAVRIFVGSDSTSTVFIVIATLYPLVITAVIIAYLKRYYRHEFGEDLIFLGGIGAVLLSALFAFTAQSIIWGQRTHGITMEDPLVLTTEMAINGALFGLIYGHFYGLSLVQQRQLQRKNERLNEFASVVSHDLRNPLNVAHGRLELLKEECDSNNLDLMERALERMDEIIGDVLELSQAGELAGEVEVLDMSEVAKASWANVDTESAELAINTHQSILADETRFKQLLENLFRNAVEHGGGAITITVGSLPSGFYVADDGSGISVEDLDRVFETGFSTTVDGTGMGLNIARQVAHAHDWEISVTESRDGGARFEITKVDVDR